MKYLPLIYAGLMRKKLRSLLTLLSIMVAFLLFGLLQGVNSAFSNSVAGAHLDRLVVQGKISLTEQLPLAYRDRIAHVPGVTGVISGNCGSIPVTSRTCISAMRPRSARAMRTFGSTLAELPAPSEARWANCRAASQFSGP